MLAALLRAYRNSVQLFQEGDVVRLTIQALVGAALLATGAAVLVPTAALAAATSPPLGAAANFAVLGASTVTNTGPSAVTGDLGVSPGTAVTGFPPGTLTGTIHAGDPAATQAQGDVATAYAFAAGEPCDTNLSGQDLGGMTLPPAVYCFDSSAQLTGTLHLDAQGNPTAAWLFQTTSTLTTASNSAVVLENGAAACNGNNVTWKVGSSATVGSGSSFVGNILANTSITFNAGASSAGSLYAHTGAVTLDSSNVSTCAGSGSGGGNGPAQRLTGRAYGLRADAALLGVPILTVPRTPDTGPVSTTSSSSTSTPCVASLTGLLTAHVLCANVTTTAVPSRSVATASVADASVAIAGIPTISLTAVQSSSATTCVGSAGNTTIAFLKVGGTVVIGQPTQVAPNTRISVGVVSLVLNEQLRFTTPDQGLTVNAIRIDVNTLGLATVHLIIASSESDIGNCP
jgi:hypothetical protein